MRLEELHSFLKILETGSFQMAAEQCGISQPTVSRHIQSLEASLGTALLHRSRHATPTVAGDLLRSHAQKICAEWQSAKAKISDLQEGKAEEFCIAAIHSVCQYLLPQVLPSFYQQFPHTQLRVTALGSDRSLKVLKDGLVDVGIVMSGKQRLRGTEFVSKLLYRERILVLVAADHPLAPCQELTWQAIAQYPQAVFKDGYSMRRLVEEEFLKQGLPLRLVLELNTPDAFVGVVRSSSLVALLPESALTTARHDPTLAVRPLSEPIDREVIAVTTSDRLQLPPVQYFLSLLPTAQ